MKNLTRRSLIKSALVLPFALQASKSNLFAQSGKINYWHHFTSETEFKGMERVISLFSNKYPDVGLTQENIPNADFMAKFTSGVLANARADTSMVTSDRLPDMVAMDGLVPITKNVNNWNLKKYFPANRWEGVSIDGEIYGIPAFTFVDWMYYRKDWFDEAGISGPPKTFDEFVNAAVKLTDPSKGRYGFGMRGGGGGQMFILDMIESFGSKIVVDGEVAIDRKKMIDGIRWYSDLMTKHKVVPPSAPGDSYRQIMEGFKTGQTAMVWHHTGSLTEIGGALEAGQQFMSATRPSGPDQHVARLAYLYNGIMTDRNFDAAWAWISFWAELDPTIAFLEETGYFPSSAQVAEDARISGNMMYKAAVDTLSFGRLPPKFIGVSGWASGTVLPEFQKILVGDSTVENAVDRMIKGLEETL